MNLLSLKVPNMIYFISKYINNVGLVLVVRVEVVERGRWTSRRSPKMSSSIRFESGWKKDADRQAIREAREKVLEKAKAKAEKEADRREKEDGWMLPSLERDLGEDKKKKKKSKKEKKEKKEKKKKEKKAKKKKKKKKSSSSSDSSEEDEDEWVEKKPDVKEENVPNEVPSKRQDWMEMAGDLFGVPATGRKEQGQKGETEKQKRRREEEEAHKIKQDRLELNPNLKPAGMQREENSSAAKIGDGGALWLKKAFKRAQERAQAEGRSIEEIAAERWGSLENFNRLLAKAEGRDPDKQSGAMKGERSRNDRIRDFRRERRSRSRDRTMRKRSRSRSRSRDRRRSRSRSRDRKMSRRDRSRSRERRRRRQRSSSSSSSSSSRSRSPAEPRRKRASFARPDGNDEENRRLSSQSRFVSAGSRGSGGSWKTSDRKDREHKEAFERNKKTKTASSSEDSSDNEQKKVVSDTSQKEKVQREQEEEAVPVLSEKEMNALGAKLVKAELMGNDALVAKLKAKLEAARGAKAAMKAAGESGEVEQETVVLTRTDAKGMTRPVEAVEGSSHRDGGRRRRKKEKVETHSKGERQRYFADDDRYDLKQMFEREKLSTAEDQNAMMSRLAGRAVEKTNEEYDLDDMFADRASRKGLSEEQEKERERDRAIAEHRKQALALDDCSMCLGGRNMQKHLLVAVGRTCHLSLPAHASLTDGHCIIAPLGHVAASTLLDEDVWREMQEFRSALVRLYAAEDEDCVFFESCLNVRGQRSHLKLECVPLPREMGDVAPMYFQKAIQECEGMWAQNVKLVNLKDKNIRRAVPRELPYFHVDFGMQDGFAHVVEDEKTFPNNFAQGTSLF